MLADHETWPYQLEQVLRQHGASVEVVNAGVNGANIHDVLETMIRLSNVIRFDYAVVTSAYNNHHLLPMERRFTWARRLDFYLYNASVLHVLLKEKLSLRAGQPLDYALYRQEIRVEAAAVEAWRAMYRRRLEQLVLVSQERGIHLVIASQPEQFYENRLNQVSTLDAAAIAEIGQRLAQRGTIYRAELEFYMQGVLNLEAQAVAKAAHLPFFDGASVFLGSVDRYLLDPIHPSIEGAQVLARALSAFLLPTLTTRHSQQAPPSPATKADGSSEPDARRGNFRHQPRRPGQPALPATSSQLPPFGVRFLGGHVSLLRFRGHRPKGGHDGTPGVTQLQPPIGDPNIAPCMAQDLANGGPPS